MIKLCVSDEERSIMKFYSFGTLFYIHLIWEVFIDITACDQTDKFRCNNGRCIYSYQKCDAYDNCGDNSDESGCGESNFVSFNSLEILRRNC